MRLKSAARKVSTDSHARADPITPPETKDFPVVFDLLMGEENITVAVCSSFDSRDVFCTDMSVIDQKPITAPCMFVVTRETDSPRDRSVPAYHLKGN